VASACTCSRVTPGWIEVTVISRVSGSGSNTQRSVISRVGPLVFTPSRSRPARRLAVAERGDEIELRHEAALDCAMMMKISPQEVAISGAPPPPGSRTFGLS
jgi:hypothetical protein